MSTAFTTVDSTRRTLEPMSVVAQPPVAKKPTQGFPEEVREYVRRSFDVDFTSLGISRKDMELQVRETITQFAEGSGLHSIDWTRLPLAHQFLQQKKAHSFAMQASWAQAPAKPLPWASDTQTVINANHHTNTRKRSFEDQSEPVLATTPPWRKGAKEATLEGRITHNPKKDNRADKKLKKAMAVEPSSKFKEALDNRARRFNLDKSPKANAYGWSGHDEQQTRVSSGPIVGTCQDIWKPYFRLTRAPRPSEVRPQIVLEETVRLLKKIWKENGDYNHAREHLKSARQDLTVQHIKNAFTVDVYEMHAIIALEKGDLGEYNACQAQLRALYSMKLGGQPDQFLAYRILYFIHTGMANRTGLNQILAELTPAEKSKPAVKHALAVRSAVASGNYHKLFKLYLDCPNMGAYLMDMFVGRERIFALAKMCTGYKNTFIASNFIAEELGFESYEDCQRFLKETFENASHQKYLIPGKIYLIHDADKLSLDAKACAPFFEDLKKEFEKVDIKGQI